MYAKDNRATEVICGMENSEKEETLINSLNCTTDWFKCCTYLIQTIFDLPLCKISETYSY